LIKSKHKNFKIAAIIDKIAAILKLYYCQNINALQYKSNTIYNNFVQNINNSIIFAPQYLFIKLAIKSCSNS